MNYPETPLKNVGGHLITKSDKLFMGNFMVGNLDSYFIFQADGNVVHEDIFGSTNGWNLLFTGVGTYLALFWWVRGEIFLSTKIIWYKCYKKISNKTEISSRILLRKSPSQPCWIINILPFNVPKNALLYQITWKYTNKKEITCYSR